MKYGKRESAVQKQSAQGDTGKCYSREKKTTKGNKNKDIN